MNAVIILALVALGSPSMTFDRAFHVPDAVDPSLRRYVALAHRSRCRGDGCPREVVGSSWTSERKRGDALARRNREFEGP